MMGIYLPAKNSLFVIIPRKFISLLKLIQAFYRTNYRTKTPVITELSRGPLTKAQVIHHLSERCNYQSYLEICTNLTGNYYAEIEQSKFTTCHRLMYRCPDDFNDGLKIDFRSSNNDLTECIHAIESENLRYDIILVDGWHEYKTTIRDIKLALKLMKKGGVVIVHDCLPIHKSLATPRYKGNYWLGVAYKAYIDFVIEHHNHIDYYTIDTDCGCGLIREKDPIYGLSDNLGDPIFYEWRNIGNNFNSAFRFFEKNSKKLLNLITIDEFKQIT
jgi:hypothetical protein